MYPQDDVAGCFDYYAGLAEQLDARQYSPIDVGMDEFSVKVRREPLGVVALITPWNYPLLMATVSAAWAWLEWRAALTLASVVPCSQGSCSCVVTPVHTMLYQQVLFDAVEMDSSSCCICHCPVFAVEGGTCPCSRKQLCAETK